MATEPLHLNDGYGVVHLFLRANRGADSTDLHQSIERFTSASEHNQVVGASILGGRADLSLMCLSPDLDQLDQVVKAINGDQAVEHLDSFVSFTETSEYMMTEERERERLEKAGESDIEGAIAAWHERMAEYRKHKLYPQVPQRRFYCFYPMSKSRIPGANWYDLPYDERRRLMGGHAKTGRGHQGKVLQLITGATGLDDWEWGVTLLSDDPVAIKEIVYIMRFDEGSAKYGLFGPFWVGMMMDLPDLYARCGLR